MLLCASTRRIRRLLQQMQLKHLYCAKHPQPEALLPRCELPSSTLCDIAGTSSYLVSLQLIVITHNWLICRRLTLWPLLCCSSSNAPSIAEFYPMEILSGPAPYPEGVDPTKRELYLSDEEFNKVKNECHRPQHSFCLSWFASWLFCLRRLSVAIDRQRLLALTNDNVAGVRQKQRGLCNHAGLEARPRQEKERTFLKAVLARSSS